MAKENVKKFEALLRSDEELQVKLKSAAEAAGDVQSEEEKFNVIIAPLAEESGLPFTFDELKAALDEGLEMSEDELAVLSGAEEEAGTGCCVIIGGSDDPEATWTEKPGGGACAYVGVLLLEF